MNDDKLNDQQNQSSQDQNQVIFNQNDNHPPYQTVSVEEPATIPVETIPDEPAGQSPLGGATDSTSPKINTSSEIPQDISDTSSGPPPIYEEHKNKFLVIGAAAVIFLIIFFIIIRLILGMGGGRKSNKITLTYWGLWEDKAVYDPVIADYKRQNPNIDINYVKMDPQDYRAKLLARSKDGQGPDIFRFHNTWLPTIKEVVAPIPNNIYSPSEYESTFYPITQSDTKIGKNYYGIPLEIDGLVLIYNDELFKKAGISVPPKTWEEIIDTANTLTVKDIDGKIITSGLAIGTATNVDHFADIFGWMLIQNGGDLKNIDNQEGQVTLELYRKFAEKPNNIWDEEMPNSMNAFIQRKVAMIIVPSWEAVTIKQTDPDIQLKVSTLPVLPGGSSVTLANYWIEGVSRYSKNQLEAWKFLKFLSSKEELTKWYSEIAKQRLFGEPYSRVDMADLLANDQYLGPVIQQAKGMKSLPLVSRTSDGGMNDEIIKYIEDAINKTQQGVSYEEALSTAKKGVGQVYAKYKVE